jgi:hypothetical protein
MMPLTDPIADPTTRTTGQLETELLGLAGHLAAAQCRFLCLLAEFDRRNGWAGPGLRTCAHWLSWRAGMSLRTATEHVRVAHALATLPKITEAFAAGRISYSKVRAITRIAGRSGTEAAAAAGATGTPPATSTAGATATACGSADNGADGVAGNGVADDRPPGPGPGRGPEPIE